LAIDPARPGGLYAGGQNVWRSSDGGITWHEKRHLSDNFPDSFGTSAADPKVVYVGLDDGLLRSDDEGRTWTKAAEGLPRRPWVAALAVDPRDAAVAFAAVISDGRTVSVGVYRTTDGGVTWHPRMDGLPTGWSGVPVLQMDPAHSEKLLTSLGGSIFRSTNTGGTWTLSARGFAALQVNQVTIDPFDAAQVMVSTEEGLFRSRDAGADFGMVGGGISPFGRATSMVFDPVDPRIQYVASSRTVYRSVDRGATWGATSGKGEGLLIDRADPRVLYIDGRYRTSDRGRSWQATSLDPDGSQPIYSQAESPTDPAVVLVGLGMDGIFLTEDGGASFRSVDSPAATSIVFSPDHPRTVIAGARCPEHPCRGNEAGGVRVSHDGGHTWAWINDGLPDQAEVTAAAIDPAYPGVMYAAVQGHGVWRSPNGGQLWLPFGDDMPADTYILGLTVDPTGRRLYAATLRRSAFVVSLPPTG
jgi:photosystem II stability/assembly factor-like uncharacterized protein